MAGNVSLKHYLGKSKAGSIIQPIYFRITYDRKKAELHTGFQVLPQEWQPSGERTKSNATINKELVVEAPMKLTSVGRGKLTTCFAGEDLYVQVC